MGKINRLTQDDIITDFKKVHGDRYDYSLVKYSRNIDPVKIICKIHGVFEQKPQIHRRGGGCPKCANYEKSINLLTDFSKIKKQCVLKHGNNYKYFEESYVNKNTPMKILCPIHGIFWQKPETHINGSNCPKCSYIIQAKKTMDTTEKVVTDFKKVHGDRYDYSNMNYKNTMTKIKIICKIHGVFEQKPNSHKAGGGCPKCFQSLGENKIELFLKDKNILYKNQYSFKDCFNKNTLKKFKFDFYLPDLNILIEYDGKQHFESIDHFGGELAFLKRKTFDQIKTDFAKTENIRLIRIPYTDFNKIEEILKKELLNGNRQ